MGKGRRDLVEGSARGVLDEHAGLPVRVGGHAQQRLLQGLGFRVQGLGFRVQGLGFRVQGVGFRVQGSGFRVQGSGFRVQGSGFRVCRS